MKKIISFVLVVVIMLLLSATTVFTTQLTSSQETIRVGYVSDFTTINSYAQKGMEGYGYDFLMEISKYTNWNYEFIECTYEEGLQLLLEGKIDLFGPSQLADENTQYLLTENNWGLTDVVILVEENADVYFGEISDLENKRIGVIENSVYEPIFDKFSSENNITAEIIYLDDAELRDADVFNKCDYILTNGQYNVDGTRIINKISSMPIYYMGNVDNKSFIEELDNAIQQIYMKDFSFLYRIYSKYYSDWFYSNSKLTTSEIDAFKKYNTVRVGYGSNYAPLQYTDNNGGAAGVCIDILNLISEKTGVNFEYIPMEQGVLYTENEFDMVLSFTDSENISGFEKQSREYMSRNLLMFGNLYANSLTENNIVGMLPYSAIEKNNIQTIIPNYTIATYSDVSELKQALINKDITHLIATTITIDTIASELETKNYSIYSTDSALPFTISYSSVLPSSFFSGMEKIIGSIDESAKDLIYLENIQLMQKEYTALDFASENVAIVIFMIVAFFSLILAIVVLTNRINKKKTKAIIEVDTETKFLTLYKFEKEMQRKLSTAKPNEYMLVTIDIDNFKYINEHYGYEFGTRIIKLLAKSIKAQMQQGAIAGRIIADEFILLNPSISEDALNSIVKHQFSAMNNILTAQELKDIEAITTSIGAYYIDDLNKDITSMIDYATIARKSKKFTHGNTIAFYDSKMDNQRVMANYITSKAKYALENEEFVLYIQPQVQLNTRQIKGGEILVRWISDDRVVPPYEFISIFEKNGFIVELDLYMLKHTIAEMNKFKSMKLTEDIPFSVNISRATLLNPNAVDKMVALAEKYDVSIQIMIEIEITESVFTEELDEIVKAVEKLKKAGFNIAMDDFGSHYASFSSLFRIPADKIKLDKSMIDSTRSEKGKTFVASVVTMFQDMNYAVVVEGVETQEQIDYLSPLDSVIIQGYYFSKPMPINQFHDFVAEYNEKNQL